MLRNDPLIHFLAVGGILFAALSWLSGSETPVESERIFVSAEDVAELARSAPGRDMGGAPVRGGTGGRAPRRVRRRHHRRFTPRKPHTEI